MLSDVVYISKNSFYYKGMVSKVTKHFFHENNKQDELFHIITMFIDAISQLYVHENI